MNRGRPTVGSEDARVLAGLFTTFDLHRRTLSQRASLGTADMRLLWLLSDRQPRTLRQIAEQLCLEQSTVNRQVNAATQLELLVRERDGRTGPYHFTVSTKGAAEFERNLATALAAFETALEELGDDREQFLTLVAAFVPAYERAIDR